MSENDLPAVLTISADFEAMRRRRSDISDGKENALTFRRLCRRRTKERVIEVSRGSGRLMRRVLQVLETTPGRKLDRVELERVLVENEGFDASNLLRSIRALSRRHLVGFAERRSKKDSYVSLPREIQRIPEDEIFALLDEIRDEGGRN